MIKSIFFSFVKMQCIFDAPRSNRQKSVTNIYPLLDDWQTDAVRYMHLPPVYLLQILTDLSAAVGLDP